jgi:hypothetical protein
MSAQQKNKDDNKCHIPTPDEMTPRINQNNVTNVREMIAIKQSCMPYYATSRSASNALTDMDHFPYSRFYRGVPGFEQPVVIEREAGWRPTHDACYQINQPPEMEPYPNHCFETACSTVYPCYPQYFQKFSDRNALNVQLNRACIVQYR